MRNRIFRRTVVGLTIVSVLLLGSIAYAAPGLLAPVIQTGNQTIKLETVATGLTAPVWGTHAPGDAGRLFVADQAGALWAIDLSTGDKSVFLDVSGRLVPLGAFGPGSFDERGFLGIAFHPDYQANGLLYTFTSEPVSGPADFSTMPAGVPANHQSVIVEWQVPNPADPASVADPSSARRLLTIDSPQFNHNGGGISFDHAGNLLIGVGDGGGADDVDGQPFIGGPMVGHGNGNGQNPGNVLGAVLRIDPLGSNSANGQYGIPASNPFVGQAGYVDEIFAYGFRNPYRLSVDKGTGAAYTGDVGQNDLEEVDVVLAGGNYGWNAKEGSFCFDPNGNAAGFAFAQNPCPNEPAWLIDPVAEYNTSDSLDENEDGRAVVGGFVYRGTALPSLIGRYIFGDFSQFTDTGVNNAGRLFYLDQREIVRRNQLRTSRIVEFRLAGQDSLGLSLLGFGQDAAGELYVLANEVGVPFETTGVVLKIVPPGRTPR